MVSAEFFISTQKLKFFFNLCYAIFSQPPQFTSKTGNSGFNANMSTNQGSKQGQAKARVQAGHSAGPQQQQQQQYYHYLTPPSQHSGEDCSLASPDSLGGWSTTPSPRSNSDWSDALSSPSAYNSLHQLNKGTEVIYRWLPASEGQTFLC